MIIRNKDGDVIMTTIGETLLKADLRITNLQGADLRGADLRGADLRGANLEKADLQGANLRGADLQNANLEKVNLINAEIRWTDLRRADLRGANLRDANLQKANLQGANFQGANLKGVKINNIIGNGREVKSLTIYPYLIVWTQADLAIGCIQHTIDEWKSFSDEEIQNMDKKALTWWTKHKRILFKLIENVKEK